MISQVSKCDIESVILVKIIILGFSSFIPYSGSADVYQEHIKKRNKDRIQGTDADSQRVQGRETPE